MTKRLHITHPTDACMQFSELLSNHLLARRAQSQAFHVGDWLASLGNEQLESLNRLAQRWLAQDATHDMDDLVGVAIAASAAERRTPAQFTPEQVLSQLEHFVVVIKLETYRRNSWLKLISPLTMNPGTSFQVDMTQEGLAAAKRMRQINPC